MPEICSVSSVLAPKRFLVAMGLALEAEIIVPGIQPSRGTGILSAEGQSSHHFYSCHQLLFDVVYSWSFLLHALERRTC